MFQSILLDSTSGTLKEWFQNLWNDTGFVVDYSRFEGYSLGIWGCLIMLVVACFLVYLAVVKKFEPMLLVGIAFGAFLINIPGAYDALMAGPANGQPGGLFWYLYKGVEWVIFPPLIFLGIGAMTDFGPLIANPKSLLLGAAAQVGIFLALLIALLIGFTPQEAGAIGIIGGADGPTAIYLTGKLASHLLGPIAVAAYSYMALIPLIQPPIMKLLTTKKEREIKMDQLRTVSKAEKIIFPIVVTVLCVLIIPSTAPLIGMLAFGNFVKEIGCVERLSNTIQNELMNIVSILLSLGVGSQMTPEKILNMNSIGIIILGLVAFIIASAGGILMAKFMNLFLKEKINPLIGSAGVSAVPMAARVSNKVGQSYDPMNFLLMHAMGPNVAGVIGTAIAAGVFISTYGH